MTALKWTKLDILKLIDLYRENECLWNTESMLYKRRDLKIKAWENLAEEFNTAVEQVKRKIKLLRTSFMAERKKVDSSNKSGFSGDVYKPNLFYYEDLAFITDGMAIRACTENTSNMSDLRQCSRQFLTEFISLYRENECLWNLKSDEYLDKEKKLHAYYLLQDKLLEIDTNATIESVKKKINSLRTNFRSELKKVLESRTKEELYRPSLWYYDEFKFLTDTNQETLNSERITRDKSVIPKLEWVESANTNELNECNLQQFKQKSQKRVRANFAEDEDFLMQPEQGLSSEEDSCDIFGKYLACELRSLDSQDIIYIKKLFNDIIFEAKIGNIRNIQITSKSETI